MVEQSQPAPPTTAAPRPTPAEQTEGKEGFADKVKDIAGDIKEKGEGLVDKVKDKLDGDKDDQKKV